METWWSHRQLISINESIASSLGLFVWICVSNLFRNCQHALSLIKDYKVELKNMTWTLKWQLSRREPNIKEDRGPFLFVVRQSNSLLWWSLNSMYFVLINNILSLWPEEVLTNWMTHFFKMSWKQIRNALFWALLSFPSYPCCLSSSTPVSALLEHIKSWEFYNAAEDNVSQNALPKHLYMNHLCTPSLLKWNFYSDWLRKQYF